LLWLGREYPAGYAWFRDRLHGAFTRNRSLVDEDDIVKGILKARYVKKGHDASEIEAMYRLRKYRALKKRYEG
ncbi:hypothetical protein KEM52_002237, partial [Ascosphaera acerosa]